MVTTQLSIAGDYIKIIEKMPMRQPQIINLEPCEALRLADELIKRVSEACTEKRNYFKQYISQKAE